LAPLLLAGRRIFRMAVRPPRGAFQILILHDIADDRRMDLGRLLDFLEARHGFLTPGQAEARLRGGRGDGDAGGGRAPCLLTFDDGFASNAAIARDVLAARGIRAVFFVCPGLIGLGYAEQRELIADNIFDGRLEADDLPPGQGLMTWDEIAALRDAGHTIGAHGMLHRRLSALEGEELEREILESGEVLEARLGSAPDWYAYAFGDIWSVSAPALRIIRGRYTYCRSGVRGTNAPGTGFHAMVAQEIGLDAPSAYQALIADGGLDFLYRDARARLGRMAGE